jgi:hypothetical protein
VAGHGVLLDCARGRGSRLTCGRMRTGPGPSLDQAGRHRAVRARITALNGTFAEHAGALGALPAANAVNFYARRLTRISPQADTYRICAG